MVSNPFATLVTLGADDLFASHIPKVFEDDGSQFGVLEGHISRANTQWRSFDSSVGSARDFRGGSPLCLPFLVFRKEEHAKEVPTWNYPVVHTYAP